MAGSTELARVTRQVLAETGSFAYFSHVSREEVRLIVVFDARSSQVHCFDLQSGLVQSLAIPTAFTDGDVSIKKAEFDAIENRAVLLDVASIPELIVADFDDASVVSDLVLPSTEGRLDQLVFDQPGNRRFLVNRHSYLPSYPELEELYEIDIANETLRRVSAATSGLSAPGADFYPQIIAPC